MTFRIGITTGAAIIGNVVPMNSSTTPPSAISLTLPAPAKFREERRDPGREGTYDIVATITNRGLQHITVKGREQIVQSTPSKIFNNALEASQRYINEQRGYVLHRCSHPAVPPRGRLLED